MTINHTDALQASPKARYTVATGGTQRGIARSPYYGWRIVGACLVGALLANAFALFGAGVCGSL